MSYRSHSYIEFFKNNIQVVWHEGNLGIIVYPKPSFLLHFILEMCDEKHEIPKMT